MRISTAAGLVLAAGLLSACATDKNAAGMQASYVAPQDKGPVSGVGIEGQDIVAVTDEMVRDLLATPQIAQRATPPRVMMDAENYENLSSQRINKNLLVDRLRIQLQRASQGRIVFVGQEYANLVEKQRALKRAGKTDVGTTKLSHATAGVDFILVGRINSLDATSSANGQERYTQITFELLDAENAVSIWSNMYEFKKAGMDDVIYR